MTIAQLLHLALVIVVTGTASAWTTALVVSDDITEPLRDRVWARWPRTGQDDPVPDLDGATGWKPSPGTFLGDVIACARCFGVWSTAAWCALVWATTGWPGGTVAALHLAAACMVQRGWNAHT